MFNVESIPEKKKHAASIAKALKRSEGATRQRRSDGIVAQFARLISATVSKLCNQFEPSHVRGFLCGAIIGVAERNTTFSSIPVPLNS